MASSSLLRRRPIERRALAGVFLERLMIGRDGFLELGGVGLTLA